MPEEIDCLRRRDQAIRRIMNTVEMPDRLEENLVLFIRGNQGRLSKRHRENEFRKLTDEEVASLEAIVRDAFEGFDVSSDRSAGGDPVDA